MTVGKDLSSLFQPVIKCLEFNDLEIKKLVTILLFRFIFLSSIIQEQDQMTPSWSLIFSEKMH
jgi:hypothetical protein